MEKWLDLEHVKANGWTALMRSNNRHLKLLFSLKAACRTALQTADKTVAVSNLRHDLTNAPWHALGFHDNCSTSFCAVAQLLKPEEVAGPQVDFRRTPAQKKDIGSIREMVAKDWESATLFSA